ncbi:MAG: GNAT family N-acetyltransferase [Leptospira sp.]|nr:GNAT family N-acetyltransferase [Leptospira sp.]
MSIIFLDKGDLQYKDELLRLEMLCFPDDPWSEFSLTSHLNSHPSLLMHSDQNLIGYCLYSVNPWDLEIYRIAVDPMYRRQRRGDEIMESLQKYYGNLTFFLEVNSTNTAAIALYRKWKFQLLDKRKGYYQDGNDAMIFKWEQLYI